uniref:Uncharacterized protein n=1 Tax=Arsenophonus nasoniae TaxID=638 RepID=D2TVS7_9GAMM|nr:conserved hypothetical protein [Arsenophonus nasoniae]
MKWATIFADLSAEDQTQLTNFVKAENGQSAQAIYQSLPTTVKIALQGKEIAENAGVRGAVAGSGISAIGIRGPSHHINQIKTQLVI